ncbi:MAG: efflux RND transporter periplasmic adaptor subunit [Candidatus Acidiferrales bacterium]
MMLFALGFVLVIACAAGCGRNGATDSDDTGAGPVSEAIPEVTVTKVARGEIQEMAAMSGTVAALPNQDVRVSALVPGRVVDMRVAEGDVVHVGEVIARLDSRTFHDQLDQAKAAEQQAKASFQNAQLSLKRNEDLFKRGIAARKDFEDSRTAESVAAASLHQAEAALEIANLQAERTNIVSPLNGRVVKRFVSVGEQVDGTGAQPIVEVANLSEVELLGNLPAGYLAKLRVGETLPIESDAFSGEKFTGKVVAISPAVDPATNVGLVRIRMNNPSGALRLGMYLTARIAVDTHQNALLAPPGAIYRDNSSAPRVYRVEKDKATATGVTLGIQTQDTVELLSGVKEGDTIILAGGYGLPDQATVRVKP